MNHQQIQELVPAYALDAVSQEEELELRTHMQTCADCQQVLGEHLATAADLATLAPAIAPDPQLKARLMEQVDAIGNVAPLISIARKRLSWERAVAIVSVAALIALGAFTAVRIGEVKKDNEVQRQVLSISTSTESQVVSLKATSNGPSASGKIFRLKDGSATAAILRGLHQTRGRVFALWAIKDGQPQHLQDFDASGGVAYVYVKKGLGDVDNFAVSLEPRPNAVTPRGPIVLTV